MKQPKAKRSTNYFPGVMRILKSKQHNQPHYVKSEGKPMHPNSLCDVCKVLGANKKRHVAVLSKRVINKLCYKKACTEKLIEKVKLENSI